MQTDRAADRSMVGLTLREARPFGPLRGSAADAARSLVAASRLAWSIEANWTQPLYLVVFLAIRPLAFLGLFLAVLSIGGRLDVASIGFVVVGQAVFQIVGAALQGPTHALLDDRERYRTIRYIFATPSSLLPVSVGRALVKAAIAGSSALMVIVSGVALGMPLRSGGVDLPLLLVVVPLGLLSIVGIGVALGAVCVQLRNDAWQYPEAVAGTVFLLCGAIFPLEVLPGPVQAIGAALPITWWIEGVRRALLGVASPGRLGAIPTEELVAILVVGTVVIWAAAPRLFTVVKAAVLAWPVLPFSALRITTAGILVLGWASWRGQNMRMNRRDLLVAALFGVIGQGIYQLLWAGSLGTINAGTSALLIAVTPFLTAIFASLLRIDPLRRATAIGGTIAFAGVAAVALGEGAGSFGGTTRGIVATLLAACCWASYLLAGARVIPRVGAVAWTGWSMIFGGAVLIPFGAAQWFELGSPIPPAVAIFGVLFATFGSSSLANVLYFSAVPIVGPARVASFQLLVPFLAVVISSIVLSEALEPVQALGGALIILGIWAGRQTRLPFRRGVR